MKKKSTDRLKINSTVAPQAVDLITEIFERPGTGATYILDAFPGLFRQTIEQEVGGLFTRHELYLMIDVLNGTMLTAGIAGQHLRTNVIDGCRYDNLDGKWEVEKEALWHKLEGLTIFQKACVELWVQRFWQRLGTEKEMAVEDYVAAIAAED